MADDYMERWRVLDRLTPEPFMENPGVGIDGFPFDGRAFATKVKLDATEAGEVFEAERRWYADTRAIDEFVSRLPELLALLPDDCPHEAEAAWAVPVDAPPEKAWNFPVSAVWLVKHPNTPTGRRPRYPWGIAFNFDIEDGVSLWGDIDYLADGEVGKAAICWLHSRVLLTVRIRRLGGVLVTAGEDYRRFGD